MNKLLNIFWQFFLLGWTSFGGPAAHLGYFRTNFVEKKKWLTDVEYSQLIALSQFLPGPGSSQVGFALGYQRAGLLGGLAAFVGFTLPSFAILLAVAMSSQLFLSADWYQGLIAGLKLLAVVVVADATLQMFRSFCKSQLTIGLCVISAALLLLFPGVVVQMAILIVAAMIGYYWLPGDSDSQQKARFVIWPLVLFAVLLVGLPFLVSFSPMARVISDFFQAGSMVFGGGHVVLPLLQSTTEGLISTDTFLTGYAAAQAVPGPMFTLATYLGYFVSESSPVLGAIVATLAIFLPGFLLVIGVLPAWQALAGRAKIAGAVAGINASVVGLLLSALYSPVFISAVHSGLEMALVLIGAFLLRGMKLSVFWLVLLFISVGILLL
ncbi:chromate efflux transporter [Endozoicomonas ascidiicola]|uniref:chromate efflux transporter n=1 Tax=Endozoicomonas ascidiicola TaxID=1698521 RepID=UPI000832F625|nr:chromate efflux transporter [Endozoicomonas ascidiicola]